MKQSSETFIERKLRVFSAFQQRHYLLFITASLLFTAFIAIGLSGVRMETDISKQFPSDLPSLNLQERVDARFGEAETIFVLVKLDADQRFADTPRDIREPSVMRMVSGLTRKLREESKISRVFSASDVFPSAIPQSLEEIRTALDMAGASGAFFNRDFSATLIPVSADIGTGEKELLRLSEAVRNAIRSVDRPAGVEILFTGSAPIRMDILSAFRSDSVATMAYAGIIILALLLVIQRSGHRTFITFFPMTFSLIWTYGTLGWFNIPISFATAALGSLILGLGVEYGIFYVKRYEEGTRAGIGAGKALENASAGIGAAIIGSGASP